MHIEQVYSCIEKRKWATGFNDKIFWKTWKNTTYILLNNELVLLLLKRPRDIIMSRVGINNLMVDTESSWIGMLSYTFLPFYKREGIELSGINCVRVNEILLWFNHPFFYVYSFYTECLYNLGTFFKWTYINI